MMCSVVVDQARNRAPALQVDDLAAAPGERHDLSLGTYGEKRPSLIATALA